MMISSTLVNFKERNRTSYQPDELEVKRENCPGKFKFKSTSTPSNNTLLVHKEETDNFNFDLSFSDGNPIKREPNYKSQVGFMGINKADCLPLEKLQETFRTPTSTHENDSFGSTSHSRFDPDIFDSEEDIKPECLRNESMIGPGESSVQNCTMSSPGYFTARRRSCGKVMFSVVSVHRGPILPLPMIPLVSSPYRTPPPQPGHVQTYSLHSPDCRHVGGRHSNELPSCFT